MFLLKKLNLADGEIESVGVSMDKARLRSYINSQMVDLLCEMQDNFPGEPNDWNVVVLSLNEDRDLIHQVLEQPYDVEAIYEGRLYVVRSDYDSFNAGNVFWIEDIQEM